MGEEDKEYNIKFRTVEAYTPLLKAVLVLLTWVVIISGIYFILGQIVEIYRVSVLEPTKILAGKITVTDIDIKASSSLNLDGQLNAESLKFKKGKVGKQVKVPEEVIIAYKKAVENQEKISLKWANTMSNLVLIVWGVLSALVVAFGIVQYKIWKRCFRSSEALRNGLELALPHVSDKTRKKIKEQGVFEEMHASTNMSFLKEIFGYSKIRDRK